MGITIPDVTSLPVPNQKQQTTVRITVNINTVYITHIRKLPVDVDGLGAMTADDDDVDFITGDVDIVINKLDCTLDDNESKTDLVLDKNDVVDKLDVKLDCREDDITVGNSLVAGFSALVDVTLGIGIVTLCEMLLKVTAGIIPVTALPRGVIRSRLTAVAVNKYGSERSRLSKDPSTVSSLPTTCIVLLIE